jgi:LPXTG-motif cell wall-anchored protein
MVVRDNSNKKGASNFILQDGNFSDAVFYSGGLIEGSDLRLGSTDSGNVTLVKNVSEREMRKFISLDNSSKSLEMRNTWLVHAPVYASIMSEHTSIIIIIAGLGVLIAAVAVLYYRKKRL